MRSVSSIAIALFASSALAAEPKAHLGLAYAEPKNERQMLDVYAPADAKNLPVVLWIHGGGWRAGDKACVQKKPQAFAEKGFLFVSTNYRFVPKVTVKEMTADIAKAIRWVHDHAHEYGGNGKSIVVMGHSAGAHLAALVCTDERYLKAEGLPLSILKGCVPVDVSMYDIPKRIKDGGSLKTGAITATFGDSEASQRELSPAAHVAKGKNIPPFLILHVADRPETKAQSHWLADKLKDAGVAAKVISAEGTTHGTINANLGKPGDPPTVELWQFLTASLKKADASPTGRLEQLKRLGARLVFDDDTRLIGIHLGERRVTDADLVHLKGLEHLQELDLTRTKITTAGLEHIQDLTSLKKLFLTETRVDEAGMLHLKKLKALTLLGLSGTKIGDRALDVLCELPSLRQLYCLGTAVSDAGARKFQQAVPECRITR